METSHKISVAVNDLPEDSGAHEPRVFESSLVSGVEDSLTGSAAHKGDQMLGLTETDLLGYDPLAPSHGLSETASKETNRFLDELMSDAMNKVPNLSQKTDDDELLKLASDQSKKVDGFGFEKPLPPEPADSVSKFLEFESQYVEDAVVVKHEPPKEDLTFVSAADKSRTPSPGPREETPSPVPPPVPKHQPAKAESPEPYEPTQTPEPESVVFKEMEPPKETQSVVRDPSPPPRPRQPTPPRDPSPPHVQTKAQPQKFVEPGPHKPSKKLSTEEIQIKDIRTRLNAWFNPARLHPALESLLYWRDPKKSGVVFGVTILTLLALTTFSLISVVAYLCLFALGGTICFRIYKSIMQAVQKTSDGHPFKDLLELDISIPEDKVSEISKNVVHYINTSLATLRSLFLVEDLIDSIKFLILSWVLTYIGACFNGLTLIIIGVILLFTLPTVYEKNKEQIDVYVKIAMDKLSIITNKMRAAVPEGKKEEKKDQ